MSSKAALPLVLLSLAVAVAGTAVAQYSYPTVPQQYIGPDNTQNFQSTLVAQIGMPQFLDLPMGAFYTESVLRLRRLGIVTGYTPERFGPEDYLTRAQVAVMIDRYDREVVEPLREQLRTLRNDAGLGTCGDGTLQTGERCDDGNMSDGDGCSMDCLTEKGTGFCEGGKRIGERFQSPDGCNTCACTEHGIICTLRACASSSPPPTPSGLVSCTGDGQCTGGTVCSTKFGDCYSPCPTSPSGLRGASPPNIMCAQVCSGYCTPNKQECKPQVCADGSAHASCTPDGLTINYFADPCFGSMSSSVNSNSSARSESALCEQGKRDLTALFDRHRSCRTNDDCALFEQSCPYLTCGQAVSKNSLSIIKSKADSVVKTCERDGTMPCAGCTQQTVTCESGSCVAR